jgi:hypothetical protein
MAIDTSLATHAYAAVQRQSFWNQRTVNPLVVPSHYNFLTTGQPKWDASIADAANACPQRIMAHGAGMAPIGSAAQGWYCAAS